MNSFDYNVDHTEFIVLWNRDGGATLYKNNSEVETVPKADISALVDEYVPGHKLQYQTAGTRGIYYKVVKKLKT